MGIEPLGSLDRKGVETNTLQKLMNDLWPQYSSLETTVTFDGGTLNGIGDIDGTSNPHTLLTVTGIVELAIIAVSTTLPVGASATIELGTTINTADIIAQVTASTMAANEIWHDGTSDASVEVSTVITRKIVTQNVELLAATADITAGVIQFIVFWNPISCDGNVVVT